MTFIDQAKEDWSKYQNGEIVDPLPFWLSKLTAYKELIDKEVEGMMPKDGSEPFGLAGDDANYGYKTALTNLQFKISKL